MSIMSTTGGVGSAVHATRATRATRQALCVALAAAACCGPALAQIIDTPDEAVAGIPVNYQEAEVGLYTLPDPLVLNDGERVRDAETWRERRRPEVLELLESQQFGKAPAPRATLYLVTDEGTPAYDGKALRKQVTIFLL